MPNSSPISTRIRDLHCSLLLEAVEMVDTHLHTICRESAKGQNRLELHMFMKESAIARVQIINRMIYGGHDMRRS